MYPFLGGVLSLNCPIFINTSITSSRVSSNPSDSLQVGLRIKQNGDLDTIPNGVPGNWVVLNPTVQWIRNSCKTSTIGSLYEVKMTGTGDAFSLASSDIDTWLPITETRIWTYGQTGVGSLGWSGTLELRKIDDVANIVSSSITISVTIIDPV